MRGNERKNLTLNKKSIRRAKALRIACILPVAVWVIFILALNNLNINLPQNVDIAVFAGVVALCLLIAIIESLLSRKKCRCPYCGRSWSLIKHRKFRHYPLDILNNTDEYICYNCNEEIEII